MELTARDRARLTGVHAKLVSVVELAAQRHPQRFTVIEGLRTLDLQRYYVKTGKSRTLKSRHLHGFAVDLAPLTTDGKVPWNRFELFAALADTMKACGRELGVTIEWGGDWPKFRDGPHFQLTAAEFPDPA